MSGVFGMFGTGALPAAELGYMALYALQHRGQASAGMTICNEGNLQIHKAVGLTSDVFDDEVLSQLPGSKAIGHVRYATREASHVSNAEPLLAMSRFGQISIAHDGNLTNSDALHKALLDDGALLQSRTDSEIILHLIARSQAGNLEEAVVEATKELIGAFALVAMGKDQLIGVRDPLGIRPLVLGRMGEAYILASESAAITSIGAEPVRDIHPGELVVIDKSGIRTRRISGGDRKAFCVFEYIYFARSDSDMEEQNVHLVRKEIGRVLAREHPVEVDVVIPTPDSSISAAMGYAEEANITYEMGLVKNRYVGRTFIQPTQAMRQLGVRIKLHPIRSVVEGKRVVLLDDSIVRGTTTANVIRMLRDTGAKEVHMVVASPPFTHPCHYGIDVPTKGELIATDRTVDEIRRHIGADTLHYLSIEGLQQAVGKRSDELCQACFSGVYPTKV